VEIFLFVQDIEFVERRVEELQKVLKRSNEKILKQELETHEKVLEWLKAGKDVRAGDWKALDIEFINTLQLLSAKPVVYLVSRHATLCWRKGCFLGCAHH
jgi:obg-like ATPase 1